jgi:hypothetical protein
MSSRTHTVLRIAAIAAIIAAAAFPRGGRASAANETQGQPVAVASVK